MILVHRFEVDAPFVELEHSGIITIFEDAYDQKILSIDEFLEIHEDIDGSLPSPEGIRGDTMSFFTDEGYDRFIEWICDTSDFILDKLSGIIKGYCLYIPESIIIYKDTYQVLVKRKDGLKCLQ